MSGYVGKGMKLDVNVHACTLVLIIIPYAPKHLSVFLRSVQTSYNHCMIICLHARCMHECEYFSNSCWRGLSCDIHQKDSLVTKYHLVGHSHLHHVLSLTG